MYENERKLSRVLYENKMKGKEGNVAEVIACVCRLGNGERARSRAVLLHDDERVPRRTDSTLASVSEIRQAPQGKVPRSRRRKSTTIFLRATPQQKENQEQTYWNTQRPGRNVARGSLFVAVHVAPFPRTSTSTLPAFVAEATEDSCRTRHANRKATVGTMGSNMKVTRSRTSGTASAREASSA